MCSVERDSSTGLRRLNGAERPLRRRRSGSIGRCRGLIGVFLVLLLHFHESAQGVDFTLGADLLLAQFLDRAFGLALLYLLLPEAGF